MRQLAPGVALVTYRSVIDRPAGEPIHGPTVIDLVPPGRRAVADDLPVAFHDPIRVPNVNAIGATGWSASQGTRGVRSRAQSVPSSSPTPCAGPVPRRTRASPAGPTVGRASCGLADSRSRALRSRATLSWTSRSSQRTIRRWPQAPQPRAPILSPARRGEARDRSTEFSRDGLVAGGLVRFKMIERPAYVVRGPLAFPFPAALPGAPRPLDIIGSGGTPERGPNRRRPGGFAGWSAAHGAEGVEESEVGSAAGVTGNCWRRASPRMERA